MLAMALTYVRSRAVAEEVVQEAWVGVLRAIDRFEGRASLKTWIMRILVNTALTRGGREARIVPLSSLGGAEEQTATVDSARFRTSADQFSGNWLTPPRDWRLRPEAEVLGRESLDIVKRAIERLPPAQRRVIAMRDIAGFGAEEVCEALGLSVGNQRVLLHRARARVRSDLERYLDG
jgi:RNA polymerase sigma-70 factor (ECF subfamily)